MTGFKAEKHPPWKSTALPALDSLEPNRNRAYKRRVKLLHDGPANSPHHLLLAHGAGAPMDSDFMNAIAEGLGKSGVRVTRFEFPYMAQRREGGSRRPPDRAPKLLASFKEAMATCGPCPHGLWISGKSMGGRMATLLAAETPDPTLPAIAGCLCLGYPFHPPGKPDRLRTDHLAAITQPVLIVQGARDPFGTAEELPGFNLPDGFETQILEDGDHSFKPRKRSGRTHTQALAEAVNAMTVFMERYSKSPTT